MIHIIFIIVEAAAAFLLGTILFDGIHYLLHQFVKSRYSVLQKLSRLHLYHHRFFTPTLQINADFANDNLRGHVMLEYLCQMIGILACLVIFAPAAILLAILFQTALSGMVWFYWRGSDLHHRSYTRLPSYRGGWYVTADYHALHHVHPSNYYSAYIKVIDLLLGTGNQIAGKRLAMTGANGALGSKMKQLLEKEGAEIVTFKYGEDYTYDNYEKLNKPLQSADILLLCHGSKYQHAQQANCDSFVKIIELFKAAQPDRRVPLEVWAVGSEIECHPTFGIKKIQVYADSKRNYARYARAYYRDHQIQYRHLVHSAFNSPMGPGLMSAGVAAWISVFLLKRGFRYIPVTYTGFAFLNYLRFVFNI